MVPEDSVVLFKSGGKIMRFTEQREFVKVGKEMKQRQK